MNRKGDHLAALLFAAAGLATIIISLKVRLPLPAPWAARPIGQFLIASGGLLALWSAFHLKRSILGEVEPVLPGLVKRGPYRLVRHPVYIGMTLALLGVPLITSSWPGVLSVLALFFPSVIYRARLEERALQRKFGKDWEEYRRRTGFMFPGL